MNIADAPGHYVEHVRPRRDVERQRRRHEEEERTGIGSITSLADCLHVAKVVLIHRALVAQHVAHEGAPP